MQNIDIIYNHIGKKLLKVLYTKDNLPKKAWYKQRLILIIEYSPAGNITSYEDTHGGWYDYNKFIYPSPFSGKEIIEIYKKKCDLILQQEQEVLTSFGNYLLSKERKDIISVKNQHIVTNSDYENWMEKFIKNYQ